MCSLLALCIAHLVFSMTGKASELYEWDGAFGKFNSLWQGDPLVDLLPVTISQRSGAYVILAEARPPHTSVIQQNIYLESYVTEGQGDYQFRYAFQCNYLFSSQATFHNVLQKCMCDSWNIL